MLTASSALAPNFPFIRGSVQVEHHLVDTGLIGNVLADQAGPALRLHFYGLQHAPAQVFLFVAIAQFNCFVDTVLALLGTASRPTALHR